ncbi:hypothetical protein SCA6_005566 [Theobroma cacao]
MAEIAVEFILEKIASFLQNEIASFLQNEIQILQGVPEELEYIRDDLQRMKASLRAADLVEDSDHQLKEWVRQVRDIAYDIEDVIDGFNFHHADQHGHRIHGFLYHFCCFVKNLEGYHQTADKLRKIRSRIRNVSGWQLNNAINLSTTDQGSSSTTTSDALILDSADLVGIDESKELLVRWLVERNPGRKVLSVVGMGGLGKTTLVKQVYDDERVKKHFDVHVWIALSHPFKMEDFLRNIVQQLFSAIRKPVPEGIDDMNSDWLKVVIKPFLQQWRYLIVLDNVWHINQWHAVNHAFAKNDSNRVMITTRNTDVAIASCLESDDMVFNIEPLSSDYSWDLFCRRSFRGNTCPPYLVEVSRLEDPLLSAPLHSLYPDGFRLLKVLDLRAARLQTFPGEIINLFLLRYLSLRETKVNSIPSSIGKLQNLQTLDLKHTNVTELPVEILKLQQLRHLLVYRYEFKYYSRFHSKYGFKALAGIGALQSLQKLCFIEADHRNASILEEVGKLTQLRRLGIMNLRKEDGMALCSSIQKLTNLQALSVVSSVKDEVIDLHHLASPPQLLERLYLTGRLEQLPDWIPRLQSLVIVYLKWSRLEDDPLLSLQHLSNLVHLELLQVSIGDTLSFKAGGFQKLKVLGIDKFDELRCIEMEEGAMPVIEKLSILRCKSLETVPFGIEHLTTLRVLEFFDMPEELIKTLSPNAKGGDYRKVAHIPEVYYTYCRDGEWEVYSLESSGKRVLSVETVESHLESIVKK